MHRLAGDQRSALAQKPFGWFPVSALECRGRSAKIKKTKPKQPPPVISHSCCPPFLRWRSFPAFTLGRSGVPLPREAKRPRLQGAATLSQHTRPSCPAIAECPRATTPSFSPPQFYGFLPQQRPARAVSALPLAQEVRAQRGNILPRKRADPPALHYINKIRCPSSPAPRGLWRGQEGRKLGGKPQHYSPCRALGTERLKGLLLPPQDKDPHLACPHHGQQLFWTMALCKEPGVLPQAAASMGLEGSPSAPE